MTSSKKKPLPEILEYDDGQGIPDEEDHRGCIDVERGRKIIFDFGEQWSDGHVCNRKTCRPDGTVFEERCPDLEVPEGCQVLRMMCGVHYDYPDCCDRVVCPGDDEYRSEENDWNHFCMDKYRNRDLGEQWSDKGICNRHTCKRDFEIETETCPELRVPDGCRLTGPDLEKDFPQCCPTVECPPGVSYDVNELVIQGKGSRSKEEEEEEIRRRLENPIVWSKVTEIKGKAKTERRKYNKENILDRNIQKNKASVMPGNQNKMGSVQKGKKGSESGAKGRNRKVKKETVNKELTFEELRRLRGKLGSELDFL